MAAALHNKIQQLKNRANPVNYRDLSINDYGQLIDADKESNLEKRIVEGYAVLWGSKNMHGEIFIKGAFAKSIRERGPGSNSQYQIKMCWQHDTKDPLCLFDVLTEDAIGLYFKTKPLDNEPNADRLLRQIRTGTMNNFSIMFDFVWDKIEYDEQQDAFIVKEAELFTIDPVSVPSEMLSYAMRSSPAEMEQLADETEDFIKGLPRKMQLEARQLFTRHKSLITNEPHSDKLNALKTDKPMPDVVEPKKRSIDYLYLINNFTI